MMGLRSPNSNGDVRRLLLVVATSCGDSERDILRAVEECGDFELSVATIGVPAERIALSLAERAYRALDRRVFGGQQADRLISAPEVEASGLAAIVANLDPCAVVDLTGTLRGDLGFLSVPLLSLWFESEPASHLVQAVRRRLGAHRGTVQVSVRTQASNAVRTLFSGACFIDHRSLARSIDLVARKVPMLLQAGFTRCGRPDQMSTSLSQAPPPMLGPLRLIWRLAVSIAQRLLWRDQWGMLVYRDQPRARLHQPWASVMPDASAFWADPFLVPHAGGAGLFFEELPFATGKGRISFVPIDGEGRPGPLVVVLDKPWHLSYPFQFESDGRRYMIPESSANETVDLYECTEFPQQWRFVQTLIGGRRLADATIVSWQGRLWMFAAHGHPGASNYDELHIYSADNLQGPWRPHVQNPVKIDAGSARPAGAMWVENGRIVRPTQDCRNRYGDGVAFQEVVALDDSRFEERPLDRLAPRGTSEGAAVHTFNEMTGFTVIDAARSAWRRW